MRLVTFKGTVCELHELKYQNGRTALKLTIARGRQQPHEGQPMAVATVNLPDEPIGKGFVFIKDYAENEGMYDALLNARVIGKAHRYVKSGFVKIPCCEYYGGAS